MAHTPGPWVLNGWDVVQSGCTDAFPTIAAIHNGDGALCMEQINANARLIAAAPEMLRMLNILNNRWDEYDEEADPHIGELLRKVLAQAEGREWH